jgi:hypothetical protein
MPTTADLRTRLVLPLILAAAAIVLPPSAAEAKEVVSARACDAAACRTITDTHTLLAMSEGDPADAPSQAAPFHRVRMTMRSGDDEGGFTYTVSYVPSAGLLLVRGERGALDWLRPSAAGRAGFARLVQGLEPSPAAELGGITPPAGRIPPAAGPDSSGEWWAIGLGAAAALLVAVAWLARRRRWLPRSVSPGARRPAG